METCEPCRPNILCMVIYSIDNIGLLTSDSSSRVPEIPTLSSLSLQSCQTTWLPNYNAFLQIDWFPNHIIPGNLPQFHHT